MEVNILLGTSSIAGSERGLPAEGWVISKGWLAVEVVIAVTGTTNAVEAADDDVCAQGVTSAEGAVGIVGGADDLRAITRGC